MPEGSTVTFENATHEYEFYKCVVQGNPEEDVNTGAISNFTVFYDGFSSRAKA